MKKILSRSFIALFSVLAIHTASDAQFIVKVRPAAPTVVVARPPAPSPRHVWVEGEYAWQNGQYVATPGRWVVPAYAGAVWVPGHWKYHPRRGGWYWIPGHWRR